VTERDTQKFKEDEGKTDEKELSQKIFIFITQEKSKAKLLEKMK
jgi:hypothetical protein